MRAVFVEDQHLAILDVADILGADDIERAGLRGEDRTAVELAEHQRPDAERIARADQLLVGEADKSVGAFEHAQPFDEAIDEAVAVRARDQMQNDLGVGGRLHHRAFADQLAAQRQAVGQIAVMADGKAAGIELGEQRLHVAQDRLAGGRIADMADGGVARQPIDHLPPGECVADQPEAAFGVEAGAVERDDAGGLLAAMLQCMQAERRDRRSVGVTENAEYTAFLAQPVRIEVGEGRFCHGHRSAIISMHDSPDLEQFPSLPERRADRVGCADQSDSPAFLHAFRTLLEPASRWVSGSSGNIDL